MAYMSIESLSTPLQGKKQSQRNVGAQKVFAGLPMSSLRHLMQCEDVGSVEWFVHECMGRVDNSHTG
jgi:hypothetical protein